MHNNVNKTITKKEVQCEVNGHDKQDEQKCIDSNKIKIKSDTEIKNDSKRPTSVLKIKLDEKQSQSPYDINGRTCPLGLSVNF